MDNEEEQTPRVRTLLRREEGSPRDFAGESRSEWRLNYSSAACSRSGQVPSQVALVADHGTPVRALADRERVQQVRETLLHQLVYYVSAIVVHGRKDERSGKAKRGNTFPSESETERTARLRDDERSIVRGIAMGPDVWPGIVRSFASLW